MADMVQDLRYAIRMLIKKPSFTAVVLITLSLGIGVNAAIFSFVNATLIRSLPFENPDRLVTIFGSVKRDVIELRGVSYPDYVDWAKSSESFETVAAQWDDILNITSGDSVERVHVEFVTPSYFDALGKEAEMGRTFSRDENQLPRGANVAVLSHHLWQSQFSSDPALVGKNIEINNRGFLVIGVMPKSFRGFKGDADLWIPVTSASALVENRPPEIFENRAARWLQLVAVLKSGVTIEGAQSELEVISLRLEQEHPASNTDRSAQVFSLAKNLLGDIHEKLWLLWVAVGFVLLIVCANVANLFLSRMVRRKKEIAIRSSIGAGPLRVVRLLLTETVLLALLGGALGTVVGYWCTQVAIAASPIRLPEYVTVGIDMTVIGFIFVLSVLVGIGLGIVPVVLMLKTDINGVLKDAIVASSKKPGETHRFSTQNILVALEVGVAFLVLIGAGLMAKSFHEQRSIDPGFKSDRLLTMHLQLPAAKYSRAEAMIFARQLSERIESVPAVQSMGLCSDIPLADPPRATLIRVEDHLAANPESRVRVYHHRVSPGFFETMGISILKGSIFSAPDSLDVQEVIVSQRMAQLAWPDKDPLGRRIGSGTNWFTVVGVVDDVRYRALVPSSDSTPDDPDIYLPLFERSPHSFGLVIRSEVHAAVLTSAIRSEVRAMDPGVPLFDIATMDQIITGETSLGRFTSLIFTSFGILAFLIAVVGIYAVMSYMVRQRTREIGIRIALGAQSVKIFRMILSEGLRVTAIGLGLGLAAAFAFNRVMAGYLYGVSPSDPMTYGIVLGSLLLVAVLACYLPGRRAMQTDPILALKFD